MTTAKTLLTADDLLRLSAKDKGEKRYELVRGELIEMAPAGPPHSRIAINLVYWIKAYAMPLKLGEVFGADAGF